MKAVIIKSITFIFIMTIAINTIQSQQRARARDLGIYPGILTPGKYNAITDVAGVSVGQKTLTVGDSIRTGVTVILPHNGNIFQDKVPAAVYVGNGFGKAIGFTQIEELGNIETPIALTNTLSAFQVANALVGYTLELPQNGDVRSVNPVVGETNDGWLNDIRGQNITASHVLEAITSATNGVVKEGNVGAGTGTRCLGFKGGVGTSSRVLPKAKGGYTVGVIVQTNFGGILTINGAPIGQELNNYYMAEDVPYVVDGSCMIVIATDAPLSSRNLKRLAKRSFLAFGRVGSFSSNGSGDYSIAFSTHPDLRIPYNSLEIENTKPEVSNDHMSPIFLATVEATEEAIYNSLFMAEDLTGHQGHEMKAISINETLTIMDKYKARTEPSFIDHLVYTVHNLEQGMDEIESLLGVRPVFGGSHPKFGTHNALLSLGPTTYLEVIAPDLSLVRPERGLPFLMNDLKTGLSTWALRTEHIDQLSEKASLAGLKLGKVNAGKRAKPDGTILSWQLSDPYIRPHNGTIPFLISWGDTPHPAKNTPSGGELIGLKIEHPNPEKIISALKILDIDLEVNPSKEVRIIAEIRKPNGDILFLQ